MYDSYIILELLNEGHVIFSLNQTELHSKNYCVSESRVISQRVRATYTEVYPVATVTPLCGTICRPSLGQKPSGTKEVRRTSELRCVSVGVVWMMCCDSSKVVYWETPLGRTLVFSTLS